MTSVTDSFDPSLADEQDSVSYLACECGAFPTGKIHVVPASNVLPDQHGLAEWLYRGAEIVIASVGLILGAPLILVAALLIRLDSPGPALFRHRRPARSKLVYGRDIKHRSDLHPPPGGYKMDAQYYVPSYFTLPKLRTMYCDSRERFPEHYAYKFTSESFHKHYWKSTNDPRVTRVGAILRKLSVDELPNFWPVIKGELRLVGPRPEAPEMLKYYQPTEMEKFTRTPGITGLAQVSGRGRLNCGETINYDLHYVRTRTIALDLRIILLTIKQVVARRGAF